ncbi:glucosamine 6-phosphate N-acetyltransferase isoform X2 [Ahaetulla prasina]|uniref:glucosamine 6-phosphate N-acetyltransferase isoform X2 n=1 Tax=Ahaetulla prasina TaxID=499056 RepID=UPI002647A5E7|nr:glucosamine 6-phosphate N-acetyltransferase isoform X2 [Ahaetulla prasina]
MMPAAIKKLESTPMYDPHLLKELDWTQNTVTFSPAISPDDPGEGLVLRPLCSADINRGFLKVLGQLTETGIVSPQQFLENFEHMRSSGDYYVTVVEDTKLGAIVATATLVIEHKFTHSCAKIDVDSYTAKQETKLLQNYSGVSAEKCSFLYKVWILSI